MNNSKIEWVTDANGNLVAKWVEKAKKQQFQDNDPR